MAGTLSIYILFGNKSWFEKKMLYGFEKFTIEVKYVVNKMFGECSKILMGYDVFLPTGMAITAMNHSTTI